MRCVCVLIFDLCSICLCLASVFDMNLLYFIFLFFAFLFVVFIYFIVADCVHVLSFELVFAFEF